MMDRNKFIDDLIAAGGSDDEIAEALKLAESRGEFGPTPAAAPTAPVPQPIAPALSVPSYLGKLTQTAESTRVNIPQVTRPVEPMAPARILGAEQVPVETPQQEATQRGIATVPPPTETKVGAVVEGARSMLPFQKEDVRTKLLRDEGFGGEVTIGQIGTQVGTALAGGLGFGAALKAVPIMKKLYDMKTVINGKNIETGKAAFNAIVRGATVGTDQIVRNWEAMKSSDPNVAKNARAQTVAAIVSSVGSVLPEATLAKGWIQPVAQAAVDAVLNAGSQAAAGVNAFDKNNWKGLVAQTLMAGLFGVMDVPGTTKAAKTAKAAAEEPKTAETGGETKPPAEGEKPQEPQQQQGEEGFPIINPNRKELTPEEISAAETGLGVRFKGDYGELPGYERKQYSVDDMQTQSTYMIDAGEDLPSAIAERRYRFIPLVRPGREADLSLVSKYTPEKKLPDDIINPEIVAVKDFPEVTDPLQQSKLRRRTLDRLLGDYGVFSGFGEIDRIADYCDKAGIKYVRARLDLNNLGGRNAAAGDIREPVDAEIRQTMGEIAAAKIREMGGAIGREKGDEFDVILPYWNSDHARTALTEIDQAIINKTEELGISTLAHPKGTYGGMPMGALDFNFGIAQGIPGKPGETVRLADGWMHWMKMKKGDAVAQESGYIWNEGKQAYEHGKPEQTPGIPGGRELGPRFGRYGEQLVKPSVPGRGPTAVATPAGMRASPESEAAAAPAGVSAGDVGSTKPPETPPEAGGAQPPAQPPKPPTATAEGTPAAGEPSGRSPEDIAKEHGLSPKPIVAQPLSLPDETVFQAFVRNVQDKWNRGTTALKHISPTGRAEDITDEQNFVRRIRLMPGRSGHHLRQINENYTDRILKALHANDIKIDELGEYLYARHAPEANAHIAKIRKDMPDGGSGIPTQVAEQIQKHYEEGSKGETYKSIADMIDKMNTDKLEFIEKSGLISSEETAAWRQYKHWVPLRGKEAAGEKMQGPRQPKGFSVGGAESKRRVGRYTKAETKDMLARTIGSYEAFVVRAEHNRIGQTFLKMAEENPNPALWEVEKTTWTPVFDTKEGKVVLKEKLAGEPENRITVKRNGEEYHILIKDDRLAAAMKGLDSQKKAGVVEKALQGASAVNRYLAVVNTHLAPEFTIGNFTRDIQTAIGNITADQGAKIAALVVKDTPAAIRGAWRGSSGKADDAWSKVYQEWESAGGKIEFFGLKDIEHQQQNLETALKRMKPGVYNTGIKATKAALGMVMKVNSAVESGVRLSTFKHLRDMGYSVERAAEASKNVTVDFNKNGELGALISGLYLFANANIQGTTRVLQAAAKSGKVRSGLVGILGGAIALAQMNRWLGGKDVDDVPYYDKVPDWVKERNLVIMRPDGTYYKFPLAYGYNVPYVLGVATDRVIHNRKDRPKAAAQVVSAMLNAFNPLGSAPTLVQTMAPTAVRWIVDLGINKNFMGNPIIPEQKYGPEKSQSHQSFKSTSELSKTATEALNEWTGGTKYLPGMVDIPPDLLDYFFGTFLGSAGRTVERIASLPYKLATGKEVQPTEIPGLRVVRAKVSDQGDITKFYDTEEELGRIYAQAKDYVEAKKRGKIGDKEQQFLEQHTKDILAHELMKDMSSAVSKLRKMKNELEDRGLTDKAKKIDEVMIRRIKVYNSRISRIRSQQQ